MPIVCQAVIDGKVCGYSNPDGLDFCDDCGSDLRNQIDVDEAVIDVEVIQETQEQIKSPPALSSPIQGSETQPASSQGKPASPSQPPAPDNGHAQLVVLRNGPVGKTYALDAPEIRIGRWDADNGHFPEIDLTDDDIDSKISRSHARILFENGQYFIEDLGSLNGTFVNRDKRLVRGQKVPLSNGDELIMGKIFFRFEVGQASSP